ncbi:FAD:protein FMN transferase [uncultured Rikenella sp.]|uniref:FAD:protein FMN transferase n=1 Tax=uncultured Rikenella sp. TaxID=368003 RepID=UPI002729AB53|nr:FAD:protein FMN transferase [uncultured Rikenella sp.]
MKTTTSLTLLGAWATLGLLSCAPKTSYTIVDGFTQGSTYHIVYHDPQGRDLRSNIEELLEDFDNSMSVYNPSSLLTRLNENDTSARPDRWIAECLAIARRISDDTRGAFDVTLRPLIAAYRIGTEETPHLLSQREIDSIRVFTGYGKVKIEEGRLVKTDPRLALDFNAIAQGYSSDLVGELFDSLGIRDYMVEIGGEILCRGESPRGGDWRIGIDRPVEGNMVPGEDLQTILRLTDAGLVTSGNYRKFAFDENGNKVTHTIDPQTLRPTVHNLLSATIIAPTSAIADGYATACMVLGLEESKKLLARHRELEGYLIYGRSDGSMGVYMTPNIEKRVAR